MVLQLTHFVDSVRLWSVENEMFKAVVELVSQLDIGRVDEDLVLIENAPGCLTHNDKLVPRAQLEHSLSNVHA